MYHSPHKFTIRPERFSYPELHPTTPSSASLVASSLLPNFNPLKGETLNLQPSNARYNVLIPAPLPCPVANHAEKVGGASHNPRNACTLMLQ
ncbi:hypothetical protein PCANC_04538 [Puccinia coronata f. sp. avenae]|uniref:Uncharacterized protein n=1 Tax=Puccinia coronata f. sp. avenae TaxID=200324 RepID=A0A2N5SHX7_9BASI|nr:hypothetical protein PCASD_22463 [Puccinia coronata f. sp. avenae]PLW19349.1 hypothetical protein PCANC_09123 [Puccinia coronata f. sp. avenae]PLW34128.1 hypothetical protein PCASD_11594 [Puccinia coronata f. sp. avenae]PLW54234.1 hypothetical protein PCANC_04538 [Puccinia coronata f. sp. avenae]